MPENSSIQEASGTPEKKKGIKSVLSAFLRLCAKTVLIAAAFYLTGTLIIRPARQGDNSMFPSVRDGDLCFFNLMDEPSYNEVVLYRTQEGKLKMGRIAAIEGQVVDFPEGGGLTINGSEPYEETAYQTFRAEGSSVTYPLTVDEGCYFILNDFRSLTDDSRQAGEVREEDILGSVFLILRRRGF